jgi:hypothetical protein
MALFEKIRLMQNEFDDLCCKLASKTHDVGAETLEKELQEAVKAARLSA